MATRQPKKTAKKVDTVLVRIKRYGDNGWATCGIGVRPPEKYVGDSRMKKLCPKLVPGQVIELPTNHRILKNKRLIEVVDEPEFDEFIRPWVFRSDADAAMANPSKSRLGPEQILTGLALSSGAAESQLRKLEARKQAQEDVGYNPHVPLDDDFYEDYDGEEPEPDFADDDEGEELESEEPEPDFADDDEGEELESEEQVAERASNKMLREEKDEAERVDDDDGPRQSRRTGRTGRKPASTARTSRTSRARGRG